MPPRRAAGGSAQPTAATSTTKGASQGGAGNQNQKNQPAGDREPSHRSDEGHKGQHHSETGSRPNSAGQQQKSSAQESTGRRQQAPEKEGKSPSGAKRHDANARSGATSPSAEGLRHAAHRSDSPARDSRDDSRSQTSRRQNSGNGGGNGGNASGNNGGGRHQQSEAHSEKSQEKGGDQGRDDDSRPKKHSARRGTRAGRLHRQRKVPEDVPRQGRGGIVLAGRRRDSDADSDARHSDEVASASGGSAYDPQNTQETDSSWSDDRAGQSRPQRSQQRPQSSSQPAVNQSKQPWLNPALDFFYKDNLIIINLRNDDEDILHSGDSAAKAAAPPAGKSKREQPAVEAEWHADATNEVEGKREGKPEPAAQRSHPHSQHSKEEPTKDSKPSSSDAEPSIVDRLKHALEELSAAPPALTLAQATAALPSTLSISHPAPAPPPQQPGPASAAAAVAAKSSQNQPAESTSFTVAGSSKEDEKPKLSAKAAPWKPSGQPVDLRLLATQLHVPSSGSGATAATPAATTPTNTANRANQSASATAPVPGASPSRAYAPSTTAQPFLPQGFTFTGATVSAPVPTPVQIQPASETAPPFSGPSPSGSPSTIGTTSTARPITTLSPLPSLYTDEVWSVESAGWGDLQQILRPRESTAAATSSSPGASAVANQPTPGTGAPATAATKASTAAPAPAHPAPSAVPPAPQTPPSPPQPPAQSKSGAKRPNGALPSPQKSGAGHSQNPTSATSGTPAAEAPRAPAYAYYPTSAGLQWMTPSQPMYFVPSPAASTQQMIYAYAQQPATQYVPAYVFSTPGANPNAQLAWGTYPTTPSQ